MIGRGTRLKSEEFRVNFGRNDCKIIDFVDNAGKHKLINTWTLEKEKPLKDRIFISDERKADMQMKLDLAKKERDIKINKLHLHDRKFDILSLPSISIRKYTGRMTEPATEKQIAWLIKEGLHLDGVEYTKGQASEMISNLPAADWQIRKLAQWGYDVIGHEVLNGHYYKVKNEREARMNESSSQTQFTPFV
jgi:type I site-specific restriction endonuclease